jgi:hypothetical protein
MVEINFEQYKLKKIIETKECALSVLPTDVRMIISGMVVN